MKVCMVLRDVLAKTPKIIQRKEEKGHFGSNFGPILTILGKIWVIVIAKILKLKLKFLIKSFIEIMFFISSKKVMAFRSYCWFCEKFIFISAGRWSFPGWNRYLNMGIFLPKQSNNSLYLLKQTLCQSLAVTSGIGYSKKKTNRGVDGILFWKPSCTLGNSKQNKASPLDIPQNCVRSLGNFKPKFFFLVTLLGNSTLPLINSGNFRMLFLWYLWKFQILTPPRPLFFSGIAQYLT